MSSVHDTGHGEGRHDPAGLEFRCRRGHKLGELVRRFILAIRCRRCREDESFDLRHLVGRGDEHGPEQ